MVVRDDRRVLHNPSLCTPSGFHILRTRTAADCSPCVKRRTRLLRSTSVRALSVASVIVALGICAHDNAQAQTTVSTPITSTLNFTPADNPLTVTGTGSIITSTGDAIDGDDTQAWTVTNQGTIQSDDGTGVKFLLGGTIDNQGMIGGTAAGIYMDSDFPIPEVVTNSGTINGGANFHSQNSSVVATVNNSGTISGGTHNGVNFTNVTGSLTNSGTITGNRGVYSDSPNPFVNNLAGGTIIGTSMALI
jgi:hypothetical protein